MSLSSPQAWQIFQRTGTAGDIEVAGSVYPKASGRQIEARWNGGDWTGIGTTDGNGAFSGTLADQAQGQGTVEARVVGDAATTHSLANVGIGDVFIVAGQSNNSGRGTNNQSYSHATLKAGLFGNNYVCRNLTDPFDLAVSQLDSVSNDGGLAAGSYIPLLATQIMASQSVPVAFVPCAMGGTSITDWLPGADHFDRATLYGSMAYRAQQTGAKVVLWWQGETDAQAGMSQATYNGHLDTIANAVNTDLGIKLISCKLQNCTGIDESAINAAIAEAWGDNANVLEGPDFSDTATDDQFHFQSDAKLQLAADRWWTALEAAFYT